MITEERAWTLLVEANPIPGNAAPTVDRPSVTAAPQTLHEGSSDMTDIKTRTDEGSRHRPSMWWLAAASVIIVVGIAGLLLLSSGGDDPVSSDPSPSTTTSTTTTTVQFAAVGAVLDAIDAYNAGDVSRWQASFDPDAEEVVDSWTWEGAEHWTHEVMMAANEQLAVVEPCEVPSPNTVVCTIAEQNDWHGKAGITHEIVTTFELDAELHITTWDFDYGCCEDEFAFNRAFWSWFQDAHRDVWNDIRAVDLESFPGYLHDPADMAVALGYVDEFLAQSDEYPVTSDS